MYTIDASVHINALNPDEAGSADSQAFLARVHQQKQPVYSPTLLLVEVASAISRVFNDPVRGIAISTAIRLLQDQTWIALDDRLTDLACQLGAEYRLRGADAVYAAVSQNYQTTLVTVDSQQVERLSHVLHVRRPSEILQGR